MMGGGYVLAYSSSDYDAAMGVVAGFGAVTWLICMAIAVAQIVGLWKVFTKAGEPGWAAIIPYYNYYILSKIAMDKAIIGLLLCVFVFPIGWIIISVELAKAFGKGMGFAAGLIFLAPIFLLMLGFGDAQYQGPQYKN